MATANIWEAGRVNSRDRYFLCVDVQDSNLSVNRTPLIALGSTSDLEELSTTYESLRLWAIKAHANPPIVAEIRNYRAFTDGIEIDYDVVNMSTKQGSS